MKLATDKLTPAPAQLTAMRRSYGRLDVPGPRRPLSTISELVAAPFRRAAAILEAAASPRAREIYDLRFGPRDSGLGSPAFDGVRPTWALLGMWAVSRIVEPLEDRGLISAEEWFFESDARLALTVSGSVLRAIEGDLASLDAGALGDLLPYALDPHGAGTRRSVLRDPSQSMARSARRRSGIYYTPGDVADFMATLVVRQQGQPILDPACGTGVFLRAAARLLSRDLPMSEILKRLYGVDLDPLAIDGACFVLAATALTIERGMAPWRAWHLARLGMSESDTISLLLGQDALQPRDGATELVRSRLDLRAAVSRGDTLPEQRLVERPAWVASLRTLFPEATEGFSVLANPPYAPLGPRSDLATLGQRLEPLKGVRVTSATNSFLPFIQGMWSTSHSSPSAMVVPMSIVYNTTAPFVAARRAIRASGGNWTFWSFDRTPDALFGDDVKQRVSIMCRAPAEDFVAGTSGLIRWTSEQRSWLFDRLPTPVLLGIRDISSAIPKLGDEWEADLYRQVRGTRARLDADVRLATESLPAGEGDVEVGTTAYNRLVVYRADRGDAAHVSSTRYATASQAQADWAYAVLISTLTYWLWRVDGDGFHVPSGWLRDLPYSWSGSALDQELTDLGRQAWTEARSQAVVAVNRGRRTVSYAAPERSIAAIDEALLKKLGIDGRMGDRLQAFRRTTIDVGRGRK